MEKNKVLIIRFSSFGDIIQCASVVDLIHRKFNNNFQKTEIDWATRSDFGSLVKLNTNINQVKSFDKKLGIIKFLKFSYLLRLENYTHVYDAHNNLRSTIIKLFLMTRFNLPKILTRPKDRWKRILLFRFRINKFSKPFKGIDSYIKPLSKWNIKKETEYSHLVKWKFPLGTEEKINSLLKGKKIVSIVPSAAWQMKRWPLEYWKSLVRLLPRINFVILGGKEDELFCQEIADIEPPMIQNLAGRLSLVESSYLISKSVLVISADTGLLHVADVLGVNGISLMGPTAFGFTVSPKIKTVEIDLSCRPCTKDGSGKCSQDIWQRCMVEILPAKIASEVQNLIHE